MSDRLSKLNLVDNEELDKNEEEKENSKTKESAGLLNQLKRKFNFQYNGLFFIILSIIVFAIAITIAMVISIFFGPAQIRPHAGISSEVTECTDLGLGICRQGGSGVDSAIATILCISIVRPDIAGLGGCGSMVIHNHSSMISQTIDFSCVAPPTATSQPIKPGYGIIESVAIPGVFSGLKLAHQSYGKMNWTTILLSVIQTLKKGIKVTEEMKSSFSSSEFKSMPANFQTLYKNWASGSKFIPSDTLLNLINNIKDNGIDSGITGSIAQEIIDLGFSWGGKFDTARKQSPLAAVFGDYSLYTAPLPSKGGLDLALAFEMMDKSVVSRGTDKESSLFYHKLIESLKVSQAMTSFLGDSDYGNEATYLSPNSIRNLVQIMGTNFTYPNNHYGPYFRQSSIESGSGTHISIIDSYKLYVSVSLNLGSKFGSGIVTKSGIILNDAMRLFTPTDSSYFVPGIQIRNRTASNNHAAPGKRPLNQLIPLVVYNFKRKCGVRFVVGGNHGPYSSTGNLQMIMSTIFLDQKFCPSKDCMELSKAGSRPKLHVNLLDNSDSNTTATVFFDPKFPQPFQRDLVTIYRHNNYNVSTFVPTLNSIGKVQYDIQGFANSPGGQFVYF